MFTTRHYQFVADLLKGHYQTHASINLSPYKEMNNTVEAIVMDFANRFMDDNPSFRPHLFFAACSPDDQVYEMLMEEWDSERDEDEV